MERVNQRHPWNHNEHFHGWILRNLPARRGSALDIGCGTGALVQNLTSHFTHVTGIDIDEGMALLADARLATEPRAGIHRLSFEEFAPTVGDGELDLITMVAVLHHLDLEGTLARIPRLLSPGGRLLVVGLARSDSLTDLAIDCLSAVANPVMGWLKHPRRAHPSAGSSSGQPSMPVKAPTTTWADVATAARTHLPGISGSQRLFFRYTLRWDKPF